MATRRIRHTVALAAAILLIGSCTTQHVGIPAAPSDLTTGASIYESANFEGHSALITQDISKLADFSGPCEHTTTSCTSDGTCSSTTTYDWNDCMSSLRLAPGWRATIYRDEDFKGESLEATTDVPNLQLVRGSCDHDGLNDCISSIRVRPQ